MSEFEKNLESRVSEYIEGASDPASRVRLAYINGAHWSRKEAIQELCRWLQQFNYLNDSFPGHGNTWASRIEDEFLKEKV